MSPAIAKPWAKLKRLFSIDARSLAAFRIGLGVLIALDLVARLPLIDALYTDQGLLPRELMMLRSAARLRQRGTLAAEGLSVTMMAGSHGLAANVGCRMVTEASPMLGAS